jgi:hypothetical protein
MWIVAALTFAAGTVAALRMTETLHLANHITRKRGKSRLLHAR